MKIFRRKLLSQHFLYNSELVTKLLENSSIGKNDIVLEIGAGHGIITRELIKKAAKVIALEIDSNLFKKLNFDLRGFENVSLFNCDFNKFPFPRFPFKVFSNIPFYITADIIKKLTFSQNPPADSFLVMQSEAANKFIGKPLHNRENQVSIQLKPFFETSIVYKFKKNDFKPVPFVDSVLVRIRKRLNPLIPEKSRSEFNNIVVYIFNQTNPNISLTVRSLRIYTDVPLHLKPSQLTLDHWITLFKEFEINSDETVKMKVRKFAHRYVKNLKKLNKINRTRKDKYWRNYKRKY